MFQLLESISPDLALIYAFNFGLEIMAILIALVPIFHINLRNRKSRTENFLAIISSMLIISAASNITTMALSILGGDYNRIHYIFTTIFYLAVTATVWFWLHFCQQWLHGQKQEKLKFHLLYTVPISLLTAFIITSRWTGWMFYIDENGLFQKGPLFMFYVAICIGFSTFLAILMLHTRRKETSQQRKQDALMLGTVWILPLLGIMIQSHPYGLDLFSSCASIALLNIFAGLKSQAAYHDPLTGLLNRGYFHTFLTSLAQRQKKTGLIMLDINNFKNINDTYGHEIGNEALIEISKIFYDTLYPYAPCIARYGGDEFVAVITRGKTDLMELEHKLKTNVKASNLMHKFPFPLEIATGSAKTSPKTRWKPQTLIKRADKEMYRDKKEFYEEQR